VYEIRVPRAQDGSHATSGGEIPVAAHSNRSCRDARRAQATKQWTVWRRDHERFVTLLTLSAREQVDLPLSSSPFPAGVKVQHA
jgi:hypothetical protein